MNPVSAVSWDCAGTLIDALWQPGSFAVECTQAAGLELDDPRYAAQIYTETLQRRWSKFRAANETGQTSETEKFWRELTTDWLQANSLPVEKADHVVALADEQLYSPDSPIFLVYEDVIDCLESLSNRGFRMIVLSNWDISLFRILEAKGLSKYFEFSVASLVFGTEKPDPSIFNHAVERLDLPADQVLHIGDSYPDDVLGAKAAGLQALHLDRGRNQSSQGTINTLHELSDLLPDPPL